MNRLSPFLRGLFAVLLGVVLLVPTSAALSQERGEARVQEIERGFYIQGMLGTKLYLSPPARDGAERPSVMGTSMGIAAGYDVMELLQVEGFLSGAQIRAPATYNGLGQPSDPHGDFGSFLLGAKARFAYLALADAQGIRRLHLTAHGGVAFLTTFPATIIETGRPALLGGGGMHYFTRMRHFVVGFEVDVLYGLGPGALALFPQARVSYTF